MEQLEKLDKYFDKYIDKMLVSDINELGYPLNSI